MPSEIPGYYTGQITFLVFNCHFQSFFNRASGAIYYLSILIISRHFTYQQSRQFYSQCRRLHVPLKSQSAIRIYKSFLTSGVRAVVAD